MTLGGRFPGAHGLWLGATLAGSAAATVLDAALLHRRRSYFTGGFLSVDHLTDWTQTALFFLGSLLSDAAVLALAVGLVLWVFRRLALPRGVAVAGALGISVAPIVVTNVVAYRLTDFLGDAFDFELMFDLAGRTVSEVFAVSSSQVVPLAAGLAGAVLALGIVLWLAARRCRSGSKVVLPASGRLAVSCALLFVAGLVANVTLRRSSDALDNGLRRKPTGQLLGAVAGRFSDFDGDGFGLLGRYRDPAAFDGRVFPFAIDEPGNGIDEDGVGGDLPSPVDPYVENWVSETPWAQRPPVVLIVLESFRADAFGATLDGSPVTPQLSALAASGVTVQHAYSHNGYTVQSRRHIFSGSLAGLKGRGTLIDDFNAQGYETAYFSGQDESFGGPETDVGFSRAAVSYDARQDRDKRYSTYSTAGSLAVPQQVVVKRVAAFLRSRSAEKPLFLYVNFHDTHFPYHHSDVPKLLVAPVMRPANIEPSRMADLRKMYLNTAASVDESIGRVLNLVHQAVGREPAVVVLSDHGESLFDEGFLGHGYALNDAQTRIPLIVSGLPMRVPEPFGQADLRDALRAALTQPGSATRPVIERDPSRRVFQYLGLIEAPAQVGFVALSGRVLFDFRTGRAKVGDAPWQVPGELTTEDAAEVGALTRQWERMRLAKRDAS